MKETIRITSLSAILLGSWNVAQAIPLYYEISGNISAHMQFDRAGMMQEMGLSTGDRVTATFLIDLDSDITSTWSSVAINHFDVALVSSNLFGSAPIADGALYPEAPWGGVGSTHVNMFADQYYPGQDFYGETGILGYAPNATIHILNEESFFADGTITELQPGDFFASYNRIVLYSESGAESSFIVDTFRVDSVSAEPPASSVPEPGLFWLFGVGMLGLATRRFK